MSAPQAGSAPDKVTMRRVRTSVLIGTTIEWYDFALYGAAAALVFGPQFFPGADSVAATLLAFSTFAVGFFARPVGGIVLGHFGDRIGRKKMLVLSLSMMGIATALMGLLPNYAAIGVWAPILLVLLRLVQGFGVGGGAVLTAVEFATPARRGFFGSLPQVGVPAGLFLATIAFLGVSQLPEESFASWGWRIPFVASVVLVGVGLYVRLALIDTPVFNRLKESGGGPARVPLLDALRRYPRQILLAMLSISSTGSYYYVLTTYSLAYVQQTKSISRSAILVAVLAFAVVAVVALPYFGGLAQRYGRRRMILVGLAAMTVWIFPTIIAIDSGSAALTVAAFVVASVLFSVSYGPAATFITELFDARVRFSASSVSFQLGVLLGGALAPLIAASLFARFGTSLAVSVYVAGMSVISLVGVAFVRQADLARGSEDMGGIDEPSTVTLGKKS